MSAAKTILRHLGFSRFVETAGVFELVGGEDFLRMRLPNDSTKGGINMVKITQTSADLYSIQFMCVRDFHPVVIAEVDEVCAEDLQKIFTEYTGLVTL